MDCDIRKLGYVWVLVNACDIHHGATVYKRIDGKAYTLLEKVKVGDTTVEATEGTKFLQTGNYYFSSVPAGTKYFLKVTPDDIYDAVDEVYQQGSDWNK